MSSRGFYCPKIISDEIAVRGHYRKATSKEMSLDDPQTYNEKMCWYKLHDGKPLMAQCADQAAVRDYAVQRGCGDTLNELLAVYTSVSEIDLDTLPDKFVLKAAHGSHMNVVVKSRSSLNWYRTKALLKT